MDEVNFKINDKRYTVGCEVSSDVTLLDYIRETAELRGTKYMCREGGCGACIVSAIISPERPPVAVNSCLVSVTSCEGWNITTIEKVGNQLDGYSPLQTTLAEENGTQCGYCSPGWIMSMYSLQKSNKDLSMLEIEKSFGSNICRCTGYRPILEAFKKFAKDNPSPKLKDIEDLASCKGTKGKCVKQKCSEDVDWCFVNYNDVAENSTIEIELCDRKKWFRVQTINAVFDLLFKEGDDSYMLVAGNTAKGVYPIFEYPRILIDITAVSELKGHTLDQNLIIGAGMTITETMNIFKNKSKEDNFSYLQKLYDHLSHVAHIPVRNIGTLGGNLMIKHQHNAFPSDIYVLLECVGAQLTIQSSRTVKLMVNMQQFLNLNMRGKVIRNILLPPLNSEYNIVTFKVMPRSQNAKSIVNAGFLFKLNKESKILDSRIVYGGLSPYYNRSLFAERYLIGKYLFSNATLKAAIDKLQNELVVTENPPDASVEYRKQLAINLFYKGVLTLCPPNLLNARYRSGANKIHDLRLVSEGRQIYDTNRSLWPLNQPVQKLEALIQCSGEAAYTEDIPALPNEVFAAFALSTVASGTIININYSKALKTPGVIAFYSAKDIPGLNSFTPAGTPFYVTNEEILCSGEIKYCNQPIGIIVAKTRALAERAAKLVSAEYKDSKKIVIDIKEAKKVSERNTLLSSSDATKKGTDVARVIEGDQTIYAQYHSMLETLVSISIPKEGDCLDVHAATQYLDAVQMMTARALNMPQNCIDVHVLRLGGAYGIKISRVSQVAIACSLVAKKLNRPCRFIQSLTTNMKAVGKRFPCSTNFKVAVNSSGVIQYNNYDLFEDNGFLVNEPLSSFGVDVYYNCYKNDTWNYKCYNTLTDTAKNTFCRSPGTMESIVMAESLMERIGYELSMDPLEVRVANLNETKFGALKEMVENLKSNASYVERRAYVNKFNDENRWTKRGIRFSLSRWSPVGSQYFNLILSVYHGDGTVTISHGGIEMGQGVNTKAAQICAYFLNISLDKIKVKCSNTIKSPNSFASGGSLTSTNVGICAQRASEKLLERLKPVKEQMDNPTWEELIEKAFGMGINLQTCGFINDKDVQNYNIYGVALAEVEVDILTGETEIIRVDLIQDVGQSVSPGIDIGQIEGAFIMGLGYWTSEELVYDKTTGEVLTDRTWTYHVPLARDIPLDFRVYFRKNSYSNQIMLGSKATGEPPICLSVVITFAIRAALAAARLDKGLPPWFQLVGSEVSSDVTLLDFIRDTTEQRGTKYMCREGGCGACIVSAVPSAGSSPLSVNSCLTSITSCENWDITTVEKVGNRLDGYSVIQTTLAENNGTQCGYCTPGWIMAMYSLVHSKNNLTKLEIERSFGSNVCRCTGYRPILEAFKKFAVDEPNAKKLTDIEDLHNTNKCSRKCSERKFSEDDWCFVSRKELKTPNRLEIDLKDGKKWYRVYEVADIFNILRDQGDDSYMLVAGNTAKGAYPIQEYPRVLIDISDITKLKGFFLDQNLVIRTGTTLTETLDIFQLMSSNEDFKYLKQFYDHLSLVAHIPVRNFGTVAGNLMIKHQHNDFQSDLYLLFETVGGQLTIENLHGVRTIVSMQQFLETNMRGAVILNVLLPPLNFQYDVVTFKIMPRSQNAHAIVNAGFLYKLDAQQRVLQSRVVYGGLSPLFNRAMETELYLVGKELFTNETLQLAIAVLESELIVTENPPEPSVEYRRQLAVNLFYKGLLTLYPEFKLPYSYRSGPIKLHDTRPVSEARREYDTYPSMWPLNKPIPKIEALIQCAGEAPYTEDLPASVHEVFASFVLTTVPKGHITSIDPHKALQIPGVIAFYSAADIPGLNSFTPADSSQNITDEEVLCDGEVKYFNQPLGIIVAATRRIADRAAAMVDVEYSNMTKPVIDIKETKKDPSKVFLYYNAPAKEKGKDVQKVIKDDITVYGQYHFTMETLVCITRPTEQGLEVHASSQWMDAVHLMISRALNLDQNRIDVKIRRLGGAYGMKVSRSTQVAVACSLVTQKLNRPCRFIQSLTTNTRAVGKRLPCSTDYEMGVNKSGLIQYLNMNLYEDNGYKINEVLAMLTVDSYFNCYDNTRWTYNCYNAITDTAKNTWCRAPGTLEAIAAAETCMERISYELSLDPIEVRLANVDNARYKDVTELVMTLKTKADYDSRKKAVEKFNLQNRWKKRGLKTSFLRWTPSGTAYYDVTLSVYHSDGTVAITHAGIEMGQGVNTKAVQIAAFFLQIPIEKIQIKQNDTMITPNSFLSAASFTSQYVGIGVQRSCEELLRRLEPYRKQMKNPTWEQLIQRAFQDGVDLQTHGFVGANDYQSYDIFGVTFAEVEIDVLTGEFEVLRVDLMQDVGQSVSPEIDVGQVEGAFIMGLGYWTFEHLVYNNYTGELLTDRTWNYYVPQARDIPQDFRVYFRKKSYSTLPAMGAKMTGEPSACMAIAVPFAIREAITAARLESGISEWFIIDGPYTVENICLSIQNNSKDYKFY